MYKVLDIQIFLEKYSLLYRIKLLIAFSISKIDKLTSVICANNYLNYQGLKSTILIILPELSINTVLSIFLLLKEYRHLH